VRLEHLNEDWIFYRTTMYLKQSFTNKLKTLTMKKPNIDHDFAELARTNLDQANKYFETLERSLTNTSRFKNDLLYSMTLMTMEKYFVSLMACYEELPSHHVPLGLYREAEHLETELTPTMKQTCILTGKFEGICSLEDFGYRTPANEDLQQMIEGMKEIKLLVEKRVGTISEKSLQNQSLQITEIN
jgi:hypothetical protein